MNRNIHTAIFNLVQALHWHRFFGGPIDGLSPERNADRAETNTRTVAGYAREAGRFLALARMPVDGLSAKYPEAHAVPAIVKALREGHAGQSAILEMAAP